MDCATLGDDAGFVDEQADACVTENRMPPNSFIA